MGRLRRHLTYANAMATIAVAVALGGTSYAAFSLPRNSVGSMQIRSGAVRGSEVRNGALGTSDLSPRARRALHGATGPAGPAGPIGPSGPSATPLFAIVRGSGELAGGTATGAVPSGLGMYTVSFSRSVAGCAATATLGTSDNTAAAAGRITVNLVNDGVGVQTFGPDGAPSNQPFHLIVAC